MNLDPDDHSSEACRSSSRICEPYEASIASTALSSQSSVFSDSFSAQSSIATSISDDFRITQEDARERDRICAQAQLNLSTQDRLSQDEAAIGRLLHDTCTQQSSLSYADVTSAPAQKQQQQNPRRCSLPKPQRPPPLVRQRDRKINFVENLVDSATQMVEVIWPLSVVPCTESSNGRGVLPLRTYIEETLRRSRTSYSTLQVALYYLILIRPHVPDNDFTMEQKLECQLDRALMCGRRMFLAALILASKYLQDRNYSAKAWSKMSGLKICEINSNERVFLEKINWRLHIPKPTFETWQEIVLRYTPQPPSSPQPVLTPVQSTWKTMVALLTPELDNLPVRDGKSPMDTCESPKTCCFTSPTTPTPARSIPILENTSQESTPTPSNVLPRFLEPTPELVPPTPPLARMGPLPTPQMTPSSVASSTPAVSACSSRRASMCSAMALAQKACLNRCIIDTCPHDAASLNVRRPSVRSLASTGSSPESLMSDHSRSSRSSSVSSITTVSTNSSLAPPRASLARKATCRMARLPPPHDTLKEEEEEGTQTRPFIIDDEMDLIASPEMADFSVSDKVHAPHRHSKHAPSSAPVADKSRKRCRPRGGNHHGHHHHRRSELQEEVRYLLQESLDDDDDEDVEAMDIDSDDYIGFSPAADRASGMLAGDVVLREPQPPAALSRRESQRLPAMRLDGKKRTCLSLPREAAVSS